MDGESQHIKYLIVIAAVLCAVMIGYNAFYVPDTDMTVLTVSADQQSPSASAVSVGGEYTPEPTGERKSGAEAPTVSSPAAPRAVSSQPQKTAASPAAGEKVNLNTATQEQLETLDGIGGALAGRILSYRQKHGKFQRIDELKEVSGIGDKKFEAIRSFVTVS